MPSHLPMDTQLISGRASSPADTHCQRPGGNLLEGRYQPSLVTVLKVTRKPQTGKPNGMADRWGEGPSPRPGSGPEDWGCTRETGSHHPAEGELDRGAQGPPVARAESSHRASRPEKARWGKGGQATEDLMGMSSTWAFTLRVEGNFQNNWAP